MSKIELNIKHLTTAIAYPAGAIGTILTLSKTEKAVNNRDVVLDYVRHILVQLLDGQPLVYDDEWQPTSQTMTRKFIGKWAVLLESYFGDQDAKEMLSKINYIESDEELSETWAEFLMCSTGINNIFFHNERLASVLAAISRIEVTDAKVAVIKDLLIVTINEELVRQITVAGVGMRVVRDEVYTIIHPEDKLPTDMKDPIED